MIADIEIENWSCNPDHAHSRGGCIHRQALDIFYLCAKIDDSSLNRSRDAIGDHKIYSGSLDPDHAHFKGHVSLVCWDLS